MNCSRFGLRKPYVHLERREDKFQKLTDLCIIDPGLWLRFWNTNPQNLIYWQLQTRSKIVNLTRSRSRTGEKWVSSDLAGSGTPWIWWKSGAFEWRIQILELSRSSLNYFVSLRMRISSTLVVDSMRLTQWLMHYRGSISMCTSHNVCTLYISSWKLKYTVQ